MLCGINRRSAPLLFLCLFFSLELAANGSERVDNFVLLDQTGKAQELYYHTNAKALVIVSHSTRTKNNEELFAALQELRDEFPHSDVKFFLLNADPADNRKTVAQQTEALEHPFPVMLDEGQLITEALGITHVGEALVVNPDNWQRVYRGPVGKKSGKAKAYLADALSKHLNGEAIDIAERAMPATAPRLSLPSAKQVQSRQTISYSDTIAPLLLEKCVDCHRPEGIGPWAMTSHTMVKGFAPMIKEVVLTKRMPPWHADPHVNSFRDDISLSVAEKQALVHWIDAGAPRGEGKDPLAEVRAPDSEWTLGEPDLVIELPSFDIPATGVLDYQFFEVLNPYPEDVWIKAVQIIPGDRTVLHHAISTFGAPENPEEPVRPAGDGGEIDSLMQEQLMTFVPGNEHYIYPEETALLLPEGSSFFTQMHYTTTGKATTDKSTIGLYFRDEPPKHVLRHYAIVNPTISIPPMDGAHEEAAYFEFQHDAIIYSLFPHSHYRGASSKFSLRYPDGRETSLLSVPNYDFNWQRYFRLKEPFEVPAGSKLIHSTVYDNSPQLDSNPDPSKTVAWGLQSWEEMLYGGVSFRYRESDLQTQEPDTLQLNVDLLMGYMDADMDGRLTLAEMPEPMQKRMEPMVPWFDANRNDGLEHVELKRLFVMQREQREKREAEQAE